MGQILTGSSPLSGGSPAAWRSLTRSIGLLPKMKNQMFPCASTTPPSLPAPNSLMFARRLNRNFSFLLLVSCLTACAQEGPAEPTPEAARQFLQLRGDQYDQPSFFRAAAASDAIAVNGFLTAGMNVNVKDQNDDTALTAAADRGDLQIVNVLLKGGADVNAKGRNNWTALL